MGLAASQARLLSITSRMADNELRSQLINNAKMRLTTDSSRVSDEYIAALNKTQMMFTNFDADGNEVYQALTFNALTSYSSYNTQYGIVNSAGQIIVSNSDATKFERSANLEEFLEQYGLEKKTDYFDTIANSPEFIEKGIGYYDNYGVWQQMNISIDEMQAIYEGEIDNYGVNHYGEVDSLNSVEYGDYEKLVSEFNVAENYYKSVMKKQMKNWISGITSVASTSGGTTNYLLYEGKTLEHYYLLASQIANADLESMGEAGANSYINNKIAALLPAFYSFANSVGFVKSGNSVVISPSAANKMLLAYDDKATGRENDELLAIMNAQLQVLSYAAGSTQTVYGYTEGVPTGFVALDSDGNVQSYITSGTTMYISDTGTGTVTNIDGYPGGTGYISTTGDENATKVLHFAQDASLTYVKLYLRTLHEGETADYTDADNVGWKYTYDGDEYFSEREKEFEINNPDSPYKGTLIAQTRTITAEEQKYAIEYLFTAFRNNLLNNLSENPFKMKDQVVMKAYNDYKAAAVALANFIYGENANDITSSSDFEKYMKYLDDPSWILSTNSVIADVDNDGYDDKIAKSHLNPWAGTPTTAPMPYTETAIINEEEYTVSYQAVKDLFLLECMQNHYGVPNYTWIDKNNPNENGEAKAQWYINLYEKMKQGYKRIGDGLGNNQEWMQFAFESGLVHMEQINKKSEWVPTLYSNCSTITESTVDVDITLAEAKYKREMNKIQAKDKQYDMQLKNIDTEHEALKQEYETIKEVITKNIDRNFKLFTQG